MSIGGLECGVFPVSNDYIFLRKQDEHGNRTNPFSSAHIPGRAKGPENGECAEWASKSIRQTALLLVACVNSVGKGLCLRGGGSLGWRGLSEEDSPVPTRSPSC